MTEGRIDDSPPAVLVENLVIRYGGTIAVDGVSFTADKSQVTVILGPNGAGKTSTVEHLEGYRPADSGRARVLGLDPIRDHGQLTSKVGLMLQQGGIPTGIRPKELLDQYAGFFADPMDPTELLSMVGLEDLDRATYRRMSGGERQRLSLALALIGRPEVVFLDEPTAGVDLSGRDLIRSVVTELRRKEVCVVLTTHDLDEAERLADKVVIIDHGKVVADGSPAELVASPGSGELQFSAAPGLDLAVMTADLGHEIHEVTPGEYMIDSSPSPKLVASVTAWLADRDLDLLDLRAGRKRLDDVFRRLTSEHHSTGTRGGR